VRGGSVGPAQVVVQVEVREKEIKKEEGRGARAGQACMLRWPEGHAAARPGGPNGQWPSSSSGHARAGRREETEVAGGLPRGDGGRR
jgi:hypothetical protein